MSTLRAVEICAGAGGQAIGLHRAGFHHELAIELDANAAATLRLNTDWAVAEGDVADPSVWDPSDYEGIDLLAGGVPCPPFSIAGKQLGSADERDLFAWAVEQVGVMRPRALLLENVRGLASSRFAAYRQRVLDRLAEFGYVADWKLLHAADFGVAQLRPRFVLVAMRPEDAAYFEWPAPSTARTTVGEALQDLMAANGWPHAAEWAALANGIGPTLVGGSKKHGGADLGPTRAKRAWAELYVDGKGVANEAPGPASPSPIEQAPRLTVEMVARLQGFRDDFDWQFSGKKTSQYRQIGNAFPPPVAQAIATSIASALDHRGEKHPVPQLVSAVHDPVYRTLSESSTFVHSTALLELLTAQKDPYRSLMNRLEILSRDFNIETRTTAGENLYKLGEFRGFVGQTEHQRHDYLQRNRARVS
ncbi:DNA (cytosine-5-)-methyltransferase [Curtobacterium sp. VKM Ac-2889]|uniref:DNA cytosine methyltransferase n=1 Tax=unclassified Curtobacterium TaxID=257496 RepID=UPI00188B3695|nr:MULTISPECIES: DNA (cytosine-5-)-methyltransferase [unclassified Curtobacterium]MBF4597931.1 DNA (cytosine-5-)-methyltransferase [Curtobacterium sp. VKM Ac-1796]MBF4612163.1 DNA (cytosine-5-)-methyltransferase [Curtobacterium sp. VKM Ac-2889]